MKTTREEESRERFTAAIEALCANIRFSNPDGAPTSIVVTSSVPDEGKTTVTAALGRALAKGAKRTCVVECDMRRPALARRMGVRAPSTVGIGSVLVGDVTLNDALVKVEAPFLWMLTGEQDVANPADLLATQRFKKLLRTLERTFDFVVIDTPPLQAVIDAAIIAAEADATVLVVREGFTQRNDLRAAYAQLEQAGAHVLGCVMNSTADRER